MRTRRIIINKIKVDAVLCAGGENFKIYTEKNLDGWIVLINKNPSVIQPNTDDAQVVSDYVNLKYHSISQQDAIKSRFIKLLDRLDEVKNDK